jgi:exonuclease III
MKRGLDSYVRDLVTDLKLDIVSFQETMIQDFSDANLRAIDPNKEYLWDWNPAKGRSGGLFTGIKVDQFDVGSRSQGEHMLQHNLWDKHLQIKWNIINVYGPAHEEGRESFLSELAAFCARNKETYIVVVVVGL